MHFFFFFWCFNLFLRQRKYKQGRGRWGGSEQALCWQQRTPCGAWTHDWSRGRMFSWLNDPGAPQVLLTDLLANSLKKFCPPPHPPPPEKLFPNSSQCIPSFSTSLFPFILPFSLFFYSGLQKPEWLPWWCWQWSSRNFLNKLGKKKKVRPGSFF